MSPDEELRAAQDFVLNDLKRTVARREQIVASHQRGAEGDAYRQELARLSRVTLMAVERELLG